MGQSPLAGHPPWVECQGQKMARNVVLDCPPLHHLRINDRRSSVRIKITLRSEANGGIANERQTSPLWTEISFIRR